MCNPSHLTLCCRRYKEPVDAADEWIEVFGEHCCEIRASFVERHLRAKRRVVQERASFRKYSTRLRMRGFMHEELEFEAALSRRRNKPEYFRVFMAGQANKTVVKAYKTHPLFDPPPIAAESAQAAIARATILYARLSEADECQTSD